MPNLFLNIPVPVTDGNGPAVDVSKMGATKTIVIGGSWKGAVSIQYATDAAGTLWAEVPNGTFQNPGRVTLRLAVHWMRAVTKGGGGIVNCDVGAPGSGATFAQLGPVPVNISTMASFKTVVAAGACNVEVSEDGVSWSQVFSFQNPGGQSGSVVAQFARVLAGPQVWMGGADLTEDDVFDLPPFPVPPIDVTIYARPAPLGSDVSGDGTLATPYETFVRAVRDVPFPAIPPGYRYFVNITGVTEVLPDGYKLPCWKCSEVTETDFASQFYIYQAGINIDADPQLVTLVPPADATILPGNIVSQLPDPITGLVTITVAPPRASWAANALKGKWAQGTAGFQDSGVIYESDTTFIRLAWRAPLTAGPAITIVEPSAHLTGLQTESFGGALTCFNIDSLTFRGIEIKDSAGGFGLTMTGAGVGFAQRCELESPSFEMGGNSDSFCRIAKNWIKGFPFFSGPLFIVHNLMDTLVGGWFIAAPSLPDIVGCVFDGCEPIEMIAFVPPGFDPTPASVPLMRIKETLIRNGTGNAVHFHGGGGRMTDCDIYGNAGNGVAADLGHGVLELQNVQSSNLLSPNGGVGVLVNDGLFVKVDAATSGALTPLTGAGGDMQVGVLPVRTWANFTGAAPINNQYDLVGMNAGATDQSTGSRLYQSP